MCPVCRCWHGIYISNCIVTAEDVLTSSFLVVFNYCTHMGLLLLLLVIASMYIHVYVSFYSLFLFPYIYSFSHKYKIFMEAAIVV